MLLKLFVYLPTLLSLVGISLVIITRNRSSAVNRSFFIFLLTLFCWASCLFVADLSRHSSVALVATRVGLFFLAFAPMQLVIFFLSFIQSFLLTTKTYIILYAVGLLAACSNAMPWTIAAVQPTRYAAKLTVSGIGYLLFLVYVVIFSALAYTSLFLYARHPVTKRQLQAKFLFYGALSVELILILTGFILVRHDASGFAQLLSAPSLTIFCLVVAYTIVRHNLFDVRLIIARSVGYILTWATISIVYGWVIFSVLGMFKHTGFTRVQQLSFAGFALGAALLYQPLKKFFDKITNSIFYRNGYSSQKVLNDLSAMLASTTELQRVMSKSAAVVIDNLTVSKCAFVMDTRDGPYVSCFPLNKHIDEAVTAHLKAQTHLHRRPVFTDNIEDHDERVRILLEAHELAAIVPLITKTGMIGHMIIGIKKDGGILTTQDQDVLVIMANDLAVALQNALRFEEIENFTFTLQQRVNDATRELRKTNEKLKQLDEAKDEFISMASHQLRTPLTSVKGYVSMVLEGDAGKINEQQSQLLNQAFTSSQRMVYLIADLLNVSRLRTGKFVIENKPTFLPDLVEGEVGQLVETAKARGLELTFAKPAEFPTLSLDETKIRQVVMNFVDNAIYYTPSGGHIRVELEAGDKSVECRVVDDGLGVPKSEQHHLFTKFYRAANARRARPDGTGLGLYMAKKVVVAQGGAIIFSSQEGKGSTFGFTFPRHKLEVTAKN
jgi:signal transduction histidine kinase